MDAASKLSVSDRFAFIVEGLCQAVAARNRRIETALLVIVWTRLRWLAGRFAAIAAKLEAGLSVAAARGRLTDAASPVAARPAPATAIPPTAILRLRGRRGWLGRLVPEAQAYAGQLRHLLADPELAAMLRAAPALGPLLRSLCWSLRVEPGAARQPRRSSARASRWARAETTPVVALPAAGPPPPAIPPPIVSPLSALVPGTRRFAPG